MMRDPSPLFKLTSFKITDYLQSPTHTKDFCVKFERFDLVYQFIKRNTFTESCSKQLRLPNTNTQ